MYWALKSREKTVYWCPKHWIWNFPLTGCGQIVYYCRLMLFATNLMWNSFTSQNSKTHALFTNVLLCYVLIYNLKVSFNFHLIFLQLQVWLKCSLCSKNCFCPYFRLFFRVPDNSKLFRLPLKVWVIRSRLYFIKDLSTCVIY